MSSLFEELNAPLNNIMWSWGAVREFDKCVFLRVWQDGTSKLEQFGNRYYTWVSDIDQNDQSLGANERRNHVALIKAGYNAYMIMCEVSDEVSQGSRKVKDFNDQELFVGGKLIEHLGSLWLENVKRIPIREARLKS